MKILFVHNHYEFAGGEDAAVQSETELLQNNHHDVDVCIFNNKAIRSHSIGMGFKAIYNTSSRQAVEARIKSFKPDVIHMHNIFFIASPSVFYAAKKLNIPVVFTLHNYRLICCNALLLRDNTICEICVSKKLPLAGIKYKCYRSSALQSALVTAITGFHKLVKTWKTKVSTFIMLTEFARTKFLNSSLDISVRQTVVMPNFVSDGGAGNFPRQDFFLFVGRISLEKGLSILLKTFAGLPLEKIVIVGEGPNEKDLKEYYKEVQNISFLGKRSKSEIIGLMKQSKALVFPSIWYEGLPLTILEAFSAGTPVIASRLGAMLEIIKDGYNGFHFNPGDTEDLERVLLKFVNLNEEQQRKLYLQARMSYEEKFHPDIHYRALMNVYEKAIEENKK